MDEKKQKLSSDQAELVAGGGTKEAEAYLEQLMKEKGCQRWDLYDRMTPEEYQHYCNLYNDVPEIDPKNPPKPFQFAIPNLFKNRK